MNNVFSLNNNNVSQRLIWLLLIILLLSGCGYSSLTRVRAVHPHPTFMSAGKPIDNRATLLIPTYGASVSQTKINGVSFPSGWQVALKSAKWCMWELLPGEYLVEFSLPEYVFTSSRRRPAADLSGKFMAENGKTYAVFVHETIHRQERGTIVDVTYGYHGTYIVELPDDFDNFDGQERELPQWEEFLGLRRVTRLR